MQAGVIVDRISGSNTRPIWIPEPAVESWFGVLREPEGPVFLVSTSRCPACGFLASYANHRPTASGTEREAPDPRLRPAE
jgi:hypothetical protein